MKRLYLDACDFIKQLYQHRSLIRELTRRDYNTRYIKNYFGFAWAILDPLFFILILFLVFGMRYGDKEILGTPFINYLITGYISYDMFSITLGRLSTSIKEYNFLVKKVAFHSAIIPIVKILSQTRMHLILLGITLAVLLLNSVAPSLYILQSFYYLFALCCLLLGMGWITSSIYLFFSDISNIVSIITRAMFFATPIFWTLDGLSPKAAFIMKLNPITYITTGYRESLIFQIPFWHHPVQTIYFWGLTILLLVIGIFVFKRLRPNFANVI